ncbi:MAG TPA: hypothetical protein VMH87_08650 [Pseudomonadales bacterium]|nr:hypothetical protein [Pseudomonadales bacterium]
MKKQVSRYQLAANQRNGHLSHGPKTPNGKAASKMNALKHGLRSEQVVVRGRCIKESLREYNTFYQGLRDDLQPCGALEEMLVQQIATTSWRLQRVLRAESGEIALSVDNGEWKRKNRDLTLTGMLWGMVGDPAMKMRESAFGNQLMYHQLEKVRNSVEKEGQLTEAAIQSVVFHGKPYSLTRELEKLWLQLQQNPDGLDEEALRAKQKEQALVSINRKLRVISWDVDCCEKREDMEEHARQAADVLPSAETLEKLLRYESALQKRLYRAMNHFERLKRRRLGENVPAPLAMDISTGA